MHNSYKQIEQNNNCPINNQITYLFFILNEVIDFSEFMWIFSVYLTILKIRFEKKIKVITVKLLVQSPGKFLCVI